MLKTIDIKEFLELRKSIPVIDVRSDKEYAHAHIPNAISLPLFTNEEREKVGICYKNSGKQAAVLLGLEKVGPKLNYFAKQALKYAKSGKLIVHCWRGGMRSASMAWLFGTVGIEVYLLEGGYKNYRRHIKQTFAKPADYVVVGGMTGSGKTYILQELKARNEQVIDLEALANHKGSAFGQLGQKEQSTTEQFENNLFEIVSTLDLNKTIWIEDESRTIGKISLPDELFVQMRNTNVLSLEIPSSERVKFLLEEYGYFPAVDLKSSLLKIQKRFGGNNTKKAIQAIDDNNIEEAIKLVLEYYDKSYKFGLSKRNTNKIHLINCDSVNHKENANKLLKFRNLTLNK